MELMPMWQEDLTPELSKKAKEELGETPETQEKALLDMRQIINDTKDFICLENDDFLIKFLRAKKYDPQRAFKMMTNYYNFKKKYPGFLTNVTKKALDCNWVHLSPVRAPDGGFIFIVYVGQIELKEFSVDEMFQTAVIIVEQALEVEASQICGIHVVLDFTGISLSKIRKFSTPSFLSFIVSGIENCWPFRLTSFHVINEPFYIGIPFNIVCPMLSKKLRKRLFFHGTNTSALFNILPPECLPKQIGGFLGKKIFEEQIQIIIARQLEMERLKKYSFHREVKPVKRLSSCGLEEIASHFPSGTPIPSVAL